MYVRGRRVPLAALATFSTTSKLADPRIQFFQRNKPMSIRGFKQLDTPPMSAAACATSINHNPDRRFIPITLFPTPPGQTQAPPLALSVLGGSKKKRTTTSLMCDFFSGHKQTNSSNRGPRSSGCESFLMRCKIPLVNRNSWP